VKLIRHYPNNAEMTCSAPLELMN